MKLALNNQKHHLRERHQNNEHRLKRQLIREALELVEQHERQHHRKPVAATL
jgi:hypothetical protein